MASAASPLLGSAFRAASKSASLRSLSSTICRPQHVGFAQLFGIVLAGEDLDRLARGCRGGLIVTTRRQGMQLGFQDIQVRQRRIVLLRLVEVL